MMQSLVKFRNKKKGFTLVELIVVIAIIGILAAILMPKFMGFTDDARKNAAISEAKSIRTIADTYYAKNGTWPNITVASGNTTVGDSTTSFKGTIGAYTASGAGAAVDTAHPITTTGNFNYNINGWNAHCDDSGNVTATNP